MCSAYFCQKKMIACISILAERNKDASKQPFNRIDIHKREIVGIGGPTGSGKSVLVKDFLKLHAKCRKKKPTLLIK